MMVPKKVFFTKGIGRARQELRSFEEALRDAKISSYNLVLVSSIFPPHCEEISFEAGIKYLNPGQIVFTVMSRNSSNEKNIMLSASIGLAKPRDANSYGYISEFHDFGSDVESASNEAEDLAASMLVSSLGIPFNINAAYDEKKDIFKMSDKIVETKSFTANALVRNKNEYTTVLAAAVFILE